MKQILAIFTWVVLALSFSLTGCGKDPIASNGGTMKLSIKAASGGLGKSAGSQAQQITITSARVVLGEIEIETTNEDSMGFESEVPLVVNLNLTGAMTDLGTVSVPFGIYEEIELEIDKLESEDSLAYRANPDLQERSIYVKGYVDGDTNAVFILTSDLDEEQEREFSPPLVVDANSPQVNVVLSLDTTTWFSDGRGGYLDPRLSQNQEAIERNIKASIKVFEDDDGDGNDDGDDDDNDDGDSDD